MDAQRTLRRPVSCAGIGLHSGKKVTLSLKPAPADFGIRFQPHRPGRPRDSGDRHALGGIQLATGLTREAVSVETVEHLLAALDSARHRQRHRRAEHAGSADHGRQRRAVRLPDPERGGRQAAAGAEEVPEGAAADRAEPAGTSASRSTRRTTSRSPTASASITRSSGTSRGR